MAAYCLEKYSKIHRGPQRMNVILFNNIHLHKYFFVMIIIRCTVGVREIN